MSDNRTFVIIGAGLAGTRAAVALRDEGFAGRVVLISDEGDYPYDRVTLSKHYLYGAPGFHGLYFHDESYYAERGIELELRSSVFAIDPGRGDVVLPSGKRFRYDALLLATGSEPVRWPGRGHDLDGVHYLRTLADADGLRASLRSVAERGGSVAVVGTGWIGCEVAAAAWEFDVPVSLIGRSSLPLEKQVGPAVAQYFYEQHVGRGVEMYLNSEVKALLGSKSVESVMLADGTLVDADLVVCGLGARPRTALAVESGIDVDGGGPGRRSIGGIVVDEYFRTSAPGVFAAGDVANVPNAALGRRSRLEHFSAAFAQGAAVARSMLVGDDTSCLRPYSQIPFFFSDQYDVWMECTGDMQAALAADASGASEGTDEYVVRRLPDGGPDDPFGPDRFLACWLRDSRLIAGMNVNVQGVPDQLTALIAAGEPIDTARLADAAVPLADVTAPGRSALGPGSIDPSDPRPGSR